MNNDWFAFTVESHKMWIESDGEKGAQANFESKNLQEIDFNNLDLRYAIFKNSNLIRAKIINCQLQGADFSGANLSYSYCEGNDFSYSNLRNTNFEGSLLVDSLLTHVTMYKTNFYKIKTRNLDFSHSNGKHVNFNSAELIGANFTDSIYDNSFFKSSNLTNASLTNVELIDSNIDEIIGIPKKQEILEIDADKHSFITMNPIIKIFRKLSKILYSIAIIIFISISVSSLYEIFDISIDNYLSWAILIITLLLLGTMSKIIMYVLIRNDKLSEQEYSNE